MHPRTQTRRLRIFAAALLVAAGFVQTASAQLAIDWFSIDGGGEMFSESRNFELGGTIAQHDAVQLSTGGGFELVGGFWAIGLVGDAVPCPADLNGDGVINIADLAILLSHFGMAGATPEDGDSDGDGDVDIADLAFLLSLFGTSCP